MCKLNEIELLKAIAGSYTPGFMQIKLTHSFDGGFANFTNKQIGTFLHEYVHYLQNVSTPWGLYMSMTQYQTMVNTYAFISASSEELELPLKIRTQELNRKWSIINLGNGYYPFAKEDRHLCFAIDRTKKIGIHRTLVDIENKKLPKVSLDISFKDGTTRNIDLGAIIINESMAAMYQMLIDSTANHKDNDLPYNLIQILCEQYYPNIANDPKKLISICYISLFSMSPAEVLFNQLDHAAANPHLSGEELFFEFVKNSNIVDNMGNSMSVMEFMDRLVDKFKVILSKSLDMELDYIGFVLDEVRISNMKVPLLSVIHNDNLTPEMFESMVNVLDIPYTYNEEGQFYLPKSRIDPSKESQDMLALIQNSALYNHIANPNEYYCCPLKLMCLKANPPISKDECFTFPWDGEKCPITPLTEHIGMNGKHFRWKY